MKTNLLIACAAFCGALSSPAWSQAQAQAPRLSLSETLTQGEIDAVMSRLKPKVDICAAKDHAQGRVVIAAKVGPSGEVESASVAQASGVSPAVASCIAGVVRSATFAATKKGGSIQYAFKF